MSDINKSFESLQDNLKLVRQTNDLIIRETNSLRIILLNLKIENARIKGNTGITPISEALERTIESLNTMVKDVVNNHRETLSKAVEEIKGYIDGKEAQ